MRNTEEGKVPKWTLLAKFNFNYGVITELA
jgi:hypothetical protein